MAIVEKAAKEAIAKQMAEGIGEEKNVSEENSDTDMNEKRAKTKEDIFK